MQLKKPKFREHLHEDLSIRSSNLIIILSLVQTERFEGMNVDGPLRAQSKVDGRLKYL